MSNISGKAYGMNVVTPMKPWRTWMNRAIFAVSRLKPEFLLGLIGLSLIHFARWVIIPRNKWPDLGQGRPKLDNDYMLFCSNFNGTWDQYIDAFSDGIPNGLDLFWYASTKYPNSIPVGPFKRYITHNQIDTAYYYNATPGAGQRDIKLAIEIMMAVRELADQHKHMDPEAFDQAYTAALTRVQNCLSQQGQAPVASLSTQAAAHERVRAAQARWS